MSDEAALPQERPWSAGRRAVSLEEVVVGAAIGVEGGTGVRDTPSWNGASDIWILLGV